MRFLARLDLHRAATELAERFGPLVRIRVMCFHCVIITDPVLATEVLRSRAADKMRLIYSFLDPFLGGKSLLTGHTDEHWKTVRKAVSPAFSQGNMRDAFGHVLDCTMALVEFLKEGGPERVHNIDNLLLRESMDVIGRFGLGKDMNALASLKTGNAEETRAVDALLGSTKEVSKRVQQYGRWWGLWSANVRGGWEDLGRFRAIIQGLLDHIKAGQPRPGSFGQLLLAARDPATGRALSDAQLFPEIAALFFAGIDTTGHTGTFILYLISQHPEVEAKILEELDSMELSITSERPRPRPLTYPDLPKLTYLQAVIKEVLRMYPPVGGGQMTMSQSHDITLANRLVIPAGTAIWVPHHAIQNVSFNWDQPNAFMPERWLVPGTEYAVTEKLPLPRGWYTEPDADVAAGTDGVPSHGAAGGTDVDESGNSKRPKRYFPFAEGPRNCVGQSLAKVSLLVTTATLLQHFSFRLADEMGGPEGVRASERYPLVIGLANGMSMHAIPRPGVT
ncbi:g5109 [Coccomyxa elongata]